MEFEVLQVSGTPVSVIPTISVTVAFRVVLVPVFTSSDVLGLFATATKIFCTGQVWTGGCAGWTSIRQRRATRSASVGRPSAV